LEHNPDRNRFETFTITIGSITAENPN
jgi:hypothetical protein